MASYTREQLEGMGRDEVRRLCTAVGISGMSKERKDDCIDAILRSQGGSRPAASASAAPKGKAGGIGAMQFDVTSAVTNPNGRSGDRITSTINVSCGAVSRQFSVVGYTVAQVSEFLKEALNIDSMANAMVDGKEVSGSYTLTASDKRLEFIKPAGTKGC
jgi:hypothetical protein